MAIGSNSSYAQYTASPRAPDEVSMSWNAGQILSIRLTTPSPAAHHICSGDLFDLCDGILQSLAGEMGTASIQMPGHETVA
jgi:hypothetical protein